MKITFSYLALAVIFGAGCGSQPVKKAELSSEACQAQGGTLRKVCKEGTPFCVKPFQDGGQGCTDSAECDGRCVIELTSRGGASQSAKLRVGVCERDNDPCGCRREVGEGMADNALCGG